MDHLRIGVETRDGWTVVAVEGALDVYTASELRNTVITEILAGPTKLVIDLSGVHFMDSSGLGVLVGAARRVRASDGELRVVTDRLSTLKLLRVSGLLAMLDVRASVMDAVAV